MNVGLEKVEYEMFRKQPVSLRSSAIAPKGEVRGLLFQDTLIDVDYNQ